MSSVAKHVDSRTDCWTHGRMSVLPAVWVSGEALGRYTYQPAQLLTAWQPDHGLSTADSMASTCLIRDIGFAGFQSGRALAGFDEGCLCLDLIAFFFLLSMWGALDRCGDAACEVAVCRPAGWFTRAKHWLQYMQCILVSHTHVSIVTALLFSEMAKRLKI